MRTTSPRASFVVAAIVGALSSGSLGCERSPPKPPAYRSEEVAAFAARAFYTFTAERNGLSVDQLAARVRLTSVPSFAQNDRCFRYVTRVDWAFVRGEACFRGASRGRLGRFGFEELPEERRLAVRGVGEAIAELREAECTSSDNVAHRFEQDGKLVASSSFEVGDPGNCTLSLLTGKVSTFSCWRYDAGAVR